MDPTWLEVVAAVQLGNLFADCKHFVDMSLTSPWGQVVAEWHVLQQAADGCGGPGSIPPAQLRLFVAKHFADPGRDLLEVAPEGWCADRPPEFLELVPDLKLRSFGVHVHQIWRSLSRTVAPGVAAHPERHTLLPLPHAFIMPGDRFRECYNWDSYWVARGLLASGLHAPARHLLGNLLHLVDCYGYVPNGARTYYTNRSQPPLLGAMALAVWRATGDDGVVAAALPRLLATHLHWTSGAKAVLLRGAGAAAAVAAAGTPAPAYQLSRYHASLQGPRPESYREDYELAAAAGLSGAAAERLFCDLASAAESGWDFSSRWLVGGAGLEHTRTTQIIPADLNGLLYKLERDIAVLAAHLGDAPMQQRYLALAAERRAAMHELMWSDERGCWHDLLLLEPGEGEGDVVGDGDGGGSVVGDRDGAPAAAATSSRGATSSGEAGTAAAQWEGDSPAALKAAAASTTHPSTPPPMMDGHHHHHHPPLHGHMASRAGLAGLGTAVAVARRRDGCYASNWVPLWCGCAEPGSPQAAAAVGGLRASGLLQPGGVATSLYATGQQWDAPNAWPPLVHMVVEGLAASGVEGAPELALQLAATWVRANAAAFEATCHMHEKYSAAVPGGVGGGGEYGPQVGFGWSNGVLLDLLHQYGPRMGAGVADGEGAGATAQAAGGGGVGA